ncbi:hypothetical protein LSH36_161g07002 [Paralvinella palmiformis]|uniref:VLRF1 domain-containing protein n=1 Tax=Paralvinella palmiformis TaxID=53620 RepID=A0AAD9JU57_9ANNE|nr:hypothetical protein LSH36_161g07002 [Paralvinella palmiformis]
MEQIKKNPSKVKNVVFLWELEPTVQLLDDVVLAALENNSTAIMENHDHTENTKSKDPDKSDLGICDRMFCLTCSTEFDERDEQREHFKSDWHRFNLKRKLKGQEIVSELKFEEITNAGDLSSISGSESSGDETDQSLSEHHMEDEGQGHIEGIGKRHPRVFLRNSKGELLSIYRCVIHGKRSQVDTPEALVTMVREVPQEMMWLIIMLAGGHFAAAVFRGNTVVEHKTFHRYVIRAKRGTVQSSRDNKGQAPKSGGATLRRYNEAALAKDVQDLLSSWSEYVKTTHRIFIRAPTYCKSTFYGGKNPVLDKRDPRIRLIPFQTRRPTLKEVHRVHRLLASAECYDISDSGDIETVFTMEQLDTTVLQTYQATKKAKRKNKAAINHQSLDCDVTQLQKSTDPETITLKE